MLANPIVVPIYAEPLVWCFAIVAMLIEVNTVAWLLRRTGRTVDRVKGPLGLLNLATWFPFLVAMDRVPDDSPLQFCSWVAGLEVAVIAVETVLIRELCAGRLFLRDPGCGTVTFREAFGLSVAGNLASIAFSVAFTVALTLMLRRH